MPLIRIRRVIHIILALLGAGGIYLAGLQITGNYHPVIAGELYRSAQPTASMIIEAKRKHGIRTILNLRGKDEKQDWYQEEVAMANHLNINHLNFRMSASRELSKQDIDNLVNLFKAAEKPILIHCKAGADRTGLATSLYLGVYKKIDTNMLKRHLSILYGHVGAFGLSKTYAMDITWQKAQKWYSLIEQNSGLTGRLSL